MKSNLGKPYIWGGDDTIKGFDCSGLAQEVLASIGLDPKGDQTANALCEHFKHPANGVMHIDNGIVKGYLEFGTLLFFGNTNRITHVAIAIDQTLMYEAGGGGSKTRTIEDAIAQNAYIRIRPIARRKDLIYAITPKEIYEDNG